LGCRFIFENVGYLPIVKNHSKKDLYEKISKIFCTEHQQEITE